MNWENFGTLTKNKKNQLMESVKHIELLGHKATDRITGFTGVVTSVSFDVNGCVQAVIRPQSNKDGNEYYDGKWFDVPRLKVLSDEPVMELPSFDKGYVAEGKKGASHKPAK